MMMTRARPAIALTVLAVCAAAGCHTSAAASRGSSPPRPSTTPQPTHAKTASYQPTTPPAIVHARGTLDRPPYSGAVSQPRVDSEYPDKGTTSIDALHYGLDLTWAGGTRTLRGTATIEFRATRAESQVSLDLGSSLHTSAVSLDGRAVSSSHPGQKLVITTGALTSNRRHTLVIHYAGRPHSYDPPKKLMNLAGLGWNVEPDGEVWTIQEPFGAYTWYPVNDQSSDKAFYDITWNTKPSWTGVSNGQLVADSVTNAERTTHWQLDSPAASYLITAAIGPYQEYQQTGPHGLPITYWVESKDKSVLAVLHQTPAMVSWLEARLGRFPFGSLGDVVVPTHSAVETQTMVTVGAPILTSAAGPTDLLHEYVHSWYGDDVTPSGWQDLWLNESFAYYVQLTWEASHGVTTTARWRQQVNQDDQRLRTQYGPPGDPEPADFAELNVYECGARMLDRLRSMLGPTTFANVLRQWPATHHFANADRDDWINFLDRATGRDLRPFVVRWLTSKRSPK
jgi:aminopeptidase N